MVTGQAGYEKPGIGEYIMKISLNWLRDYVDVEPDAAKIARILMDLGFPCEGMEQIGDDTVLDVEVTSNRGDCLGHIGMAREVAAALNIPVHLPEIQLDEGDKPASEYVSVEIHDPQLCARYTARVIEAIQVGPSPEWMVKRLEAVGMRSVNNVVDATNYAMLETGQPPHAFDYATLKDACIRVRRAVEGESLVSIDGTQCALSQDMLVIADGQGPVAIAGVMGGLHTEISDQTTTVLLEDAHFEPVTVRATSRQLGLPSDASYRFERCVDIQAIDWASQRTAQLIVQVAGGRVVRGVVDCYPRPVKPVTVTMRLSRLNHVLGVEVPGDAAVQMLGRLGFSPQVDGDEIHGTVPSWRSDVSREIDLIEEVARSAGYDKIPTRPTIEIEVTPVDSRQKQVQAVGQRLNACGYYETINVDFVDESTSGLFAGEVPQPYLAVRDSSRKSANRLRRTLLGSLLNVLKTNVFVKNLPCQVYEIANTFVPDEGGGQLPVERTKLGLVADSDFRALRTAVEHGIRSLVPDADVDFIPTDLPWAQAGADIQVNGATLGCAGVFSDPVIRSMDMKNLTPVGAELDFDRLADMQTPPGQVKAIPRFPAIQRDLSIVVADSVRWAQVLQVVKDCAPATLEDVEFVELYSGKGIETGKKSMTFSLSFRDSDGTLTHEAVDMVQADIVRGLQKTLAAQLRSQ